MVRWAMIVVDRTIIDRTIIDRTSIDSRIVHGRIVVVSWIVLMYNDWLPLRLCLWKTLSLSHRLRQLLILQWFSWHSLRLWCQLWRLLWLLHLRLIPFSVSLWHGSLRCFRILIMLYIRMSLFRKILLSMLVMLFILMLMMTIVFLVLELRVRLSVIEGWWVLVELTVRQRHLILQEWIGRNKILKRWLNKIKQALMHVHNVFIRH